jgi:hypothetical protein
MIDPVVPDRPLVFTAQSKRFFYCRDVVCHFVLEHGRVPLNPFQVFGYFLSDRVDRDLVREGNNVLVARSDEVWVFGQELANGVLMEIQVAAQHGKPIRFFSIDSRPESIRELHLSQLTFEDEVFHSTGLRKDQLLQHVRELLDAQVTDKQEALIPTSSG